MSTTNLKNAKNIGPLHGPLFFLVNKKPGMTSFDVIRIFKKKLSKRIGKIGHFGTLDPFADGLMIVGIGGATRLNDFSSEYSKEYIATGLFGIKSDTGDATAQEGDYETDVDYESPSFAQVKAALESFKGDYMQAPHKYSAAKFEGKNLYEYARQGIEIEKPKVLRKILDIELIEFSSDVVRFRVECSSGTFIRVLMEDLAQKLSTLGHLTHLTRSKIGHIDLSQTFSLNAFDELCEEGLSEDDFIKKYARPVNELVKFKSIELSADEYVKFARGQAFYSALDDNHYWILKDGKIHGLSVVKDHQLTVSINYCQVYI